MSRVKVPKTARYCVVCKTETMWKYSQNIDHSQCICCGWRHIPSLDPNNLYIKEWESYLQSKTMKAAQKENEDDEEEKIKALKLSKEELDRRQKDREKSCRHAESIKMSKENRISRHRVKVS